MEKTAKFVRSDLTPGLVGGVLAIVVASCAEIVFTGFAQYGNYLSSVGRIVTISLAIYILHRFARLSLRSYQPAIKDLITMSAVMVGSMVLVSVGRILSLSLTSYAAQLTAPAIRDIFSGIDAESMSFAIPYAAGPILIQAIMGVQSGLIFALTFSVIVGLYFPQQPILSPLVLTTSLVGCFTMVTFRSRSAYVKASLYVMLFTLLFAVCSVLIDEHIDAVDIVVRMFGACVSGLFCSFLIGGIAPILEHVGGYVTDMTLLEIATLDHPLLKDLSVQAPGTWNHSMVMGMMAEAAAEAIGANPVTNRVGAYFHDIGKMKNPLYFVENQERGENRHDKLSSSMSALIIRSHVKDGIKLSKQYRLPKVIEDMIPQHHGTSMIDYFYDKACKEATESGGGEDVDRTLYQYPGPKPQTKEAGILMLADGIEAATRTLNEPTLTRIQGLVQKMINKVFASGELDECELTLKDLHFIAKAFTRVLNGIYHHRIAYAEPAEKVHDKNVDSAPENSSTNQSKESSSSEVKGGEGQPGGSEKKKDSEKEDLKRLGMS